MKLPLTVRRSIELLGLYFLGAIIVVGKTIIMPVLMAFFLSIMLLPVYRFLKKKKFPESLAIFLSILMVGILIAVVVWFFSAQIGILVADFPQIQKNLALHLTSLSNWINQISDFSTQEQLKFLNEQNAKLWNYAASLLSGAALSVTGALIFIGLLPIYTYLMLFYKDLLVRFVFMWFKQPQHKKVEEVMQETEIIIKSYLLGLLIQIAYITVLLGGILMIIGIKHALLIGVIFAILNLIPYVGALIGNVIGVALTLTSSQELWPIFTVLGVIAFVQFLDNNILMPRIVGSKVKINALSAIIGVFVGGSIAGIPGMFLSLPMIAVLKIICDRSEMFRQWGVLLGDARPERSPIRFPSLRRKDRKTAEKLERENDVKPVKK